jgi:short-subunit dehydrogenase
MTASIAAKAPGPWHSTYAASKAFVHSFAEGIRQELSDTGVSVTSLMPGPTDTDFFDRADMQETLIARGPKDSPEKVASDGVAAMLDEKADTVGGSVLNRLATLVSGFVPDPVAGRIAGVETKPRKP